MTNPIPQDARQSHLAIVGKTGSGKTTTAKTLVEDLLREGHQVAVIDPTGAWWGLKASADGKHPGLPVAVLGGSHADAPLPADQGSLAARATADLQVSFVFDTSAMTVANRTRWFTAFAEEFLRVTAKAIHLVIDEAHLFAPQGGASTGGTAPAMLHAANNLVALGRSRGIRIALISQRPAKVHKDSLTQVDTLVAMRLVAPQDRNAVKDWISGQADGDQGKAVLESLPSLKVGEGWIWFPEGEVLDRVTFPPASTFDSSRAPATGDVAPTPIARAEIDINALRAAFSVEEAGPESEDGTRQARAHKAHIAELERMIGEAEKTGHARGVLEERQRWQIRLRALIDDNEPVAMKVQSARAEPAATEPKYPPEPSRPTPDGLRRPQARVLAAVAFWEATGIVRPTRVQVAHAAEYKPTSSGFSNILSALRTMGMITYPSGGQIALTPTGRDQVDIPAAPLSDREMQARVAEKLSAPLQRILGVLIERWPTESTRNDLAEVIGVSPTSSGYSNNLSKLKTLGLIDYPDRGLVRAADWLFISASSGDPS